MPKTSILGFSLELPEGWRGVQAVWLGPERKQSSGMLTMASQAQFRDNLAFNVAPLTATPPKEYLAALFQQMGVKTVKKEPFDVEGGGARAEIVSEAPGGSRIRQIIQAMPHEDELWVLAFSFLEGQGDTKERRSEFDEMLATAKFK